MSDLSTLIQHTYGNRLRLRVCGLCLQEERVLMVRHKMPGDKGYFLSPPGGGMEFGEDAHSCLRREFMEETHLQIKIKDFLFIHEIILPPLHAVELFFLVEPVAGTLQLGKDPETGEKQLLEALSYMSYEEINQEKGTQLHDIFNHCSSLKELLLLRGYFKYDNKRRY